MGLYDTIPKQMHDLLSNLCKTNSSKWPKYTKISRSSTSSNSSFYDIQWHPMTIHLLYGLIFSPKRKTGSIFDDTWFPHSPFHASNIVKTKSTLWVSGPHEPIARAVGYWHIFSSPGKGQNLKETFWGRIQIWANFSFKGLDVPWAFDSLCLFQTKCLSLYVLSIQLVDYNINFMHLASAIKFQLSFSVWILKSLFIWTNKYVLSRR